MTTPTPRTDAVTRTFRDPYGEVIGSKIVSADFARQLEQELNEARDAYRQLQESDNLLYKRTRSAEAERDQLRNVADELADSVKLWHPDHGIIPNPALKLYSQLPHVQERKTK